MDLIANLQVNVTNFKETSFDKSIVLYTIEVTKRDGEKLTMDKRFSEFDDLHKNLKKIMANIPNLPSKTFMKLKKNEDFEKRRQDLDNYIKELVVRPDIYNSDPFKKFLQIENFAPETTVIPPKLIGEYSQFTHGIRDFHYEKDKGLLFVSNSDMNVASRVDSYLTNMKMPWEKENPGVIVTVGAVECLIQPNLNEFKFEKLWTKTFPSQVICMYWDQTQSLLSIGCDDGKISVLRVSSELNYIKNEEILNLKVHQGRIMGIAYDIVSNQIFSISEDKKIKVIDVAKSDIISENHISSTELTDMIIDKEHKRLFISNTLGNIFIMDISATPPALIQTLTTSTKGKIRGLALDNQKNYLFTGGFKQGEICIFDLQKPGKERYSKQSACFIGKSQIRVLRWSSHRAEIFVGNQDGTITIWSAKKGSPIYVIKAHQKPVTTLFWCEETEMLMSGSKDKSIKFWQMPSEWRDKRLEDEEARQDYLRSQEQNLMKFKQQQQLAKEDSDEDDLANWHKF